MRIGGDSRVSFDPFFCAFLTHTISRNLSRNRQIRRKIATNDPPKSTHHLTTRRSWRHERMVGSTPP